MDYFNENQVLIEENNGEYIAYYKNLIGNGHTKEEAIKNVKDFYFSELKRKNNGEDKEEYARSSSKFNIKPVFEEEKSVLFNPSNEIWLDILLYGSLISEILAFFGVLFFAVKSGSVLIFFGGVVFLTLMHFLLMVSLNKAFNIQNIKNDINEIKKELLSKKQE